MNRFRHTTKDAVNRLPYLVNAQHYQYSGERIQVPFGRNDFYKIWIIESKSRLHFREKSVDILQPALFISHPLVPYAYESLSRKRSGYWCAFQRTFLPQIGPAEHLKASPVYSPDNVDVFFPETAQLNIFRGLFTQLIHELSTEYPFKQEIVRTYVQLMIYEALKLQKSAVATHGQNAATRICSMFFEALEKEFPVQTAEQSVGLRKPADFAAALSVHPSHLNRVIKEATGRSTSEHIIERMIDEAKALLKHTNWNIADIAFGLGFQYAQHFNTYFRRHTGMTPLAYRNK